MTGHRLYTIRRGMLARCYNPNSKDYARYGGRRIRVCRQWRDQPIQFFDWARKHGYADDLSIDRVDPRGDYSPLNCRWISLAENVARANRSRHRRAA